MLLDELEEEILSFFKKNTLSVTKPEFIFDINTSFKSGLSVFYKIYKDPITSKNNYLIGLPKSLIEQFPNLSFSTDYNNVETTDEIIFENFQEIITNVDFLKSVINKKKQSLSNDSLDIKNYNIDFYLSNIDKFVEELKTKI